MALDECDESLSADKDMSTDTHDPYFALGYEAS